MRILFFILIFLLAVSPAIAAPTERQIYQDSKTGQKIFFEVNPNFDIQIRSMEYNAGEKKLRISGLFSNLGPSISPDEHFKGKVRFVQLNMACLDSKGKELFRKETLPVDYYYQQPGFIRSGNQVSFVISEKDISLKQTDRCVLAVELKERAIR